jgi:hypothetical protein
MCANISQKCVRKCDIHDVTKDSAARPVGLVGCLIGEQSPRLADPDFGPKVSTPTGTEALEPSPPMSLRALKRG